MPLVALRADWLAIASRPRKWLEMPMTEPASRSWPGWSARPIAAARLAPSCSQASCQSTEPSFRSCPMPRGEHP
eukprot:8596042-Alexandrium_andersonii.AAC.1